MQYIIITYVIGISIVIYISTDFDMKNSSSLLINHVIQLSKVYYFSYLLDTAIPVYNPLLIEMKLSLLCL